MPPRSALGVHGPSGRSDPDFASGLVARQGWLTLQPVFPGQLMANDLLEIVEPRRPPQHLTDSFGMSNEGRRITGSARALDDGQRVPFVPRRHQRERRAGVERRELRVGRARHRDDAVARQPVRPQSARIRTVLVR